MRSGGSCVACNTHSNGLGQTYLDCAPLGTPGNASTYSSMMANEAARAWNTGGTITDSAGAFLCSPSGVLSNGVEDVLASGECSIWLYDGPAAGHVKNNASGCLCPSASDPTWN
jgi:hypothetical protein